MKTKIGDIILYKDGKSWTSRTIRKLTNSKYNHAGIYVGNGYILEALIKGVRLTNVTNPDTYKGIDRYRLKSGQTILKSKIMKITTKYLNRPYSKWDIVKIWLYLKTGIMFKRQTKHLICSETVALVYRDLGLDLFPKVNLDYVTPEFFAISNKLKKV